MTSVWDDSSELFIGPSDLKKKQRVFVKEIRCEDNAILWISKLCT